MAFAVETAPSMVPRASVTIGDNRRLGTVSLILGFALTAAAATFVAATLRLRDAVDFLLAVYLFVTGGVILLVLALSPFGLVTRAGLLVATSCCLIAAAAVWHWLDRPAPPSMRAAAATLAATLREPVLAILAVAVALALVYAAALAISTPYNDFDVLWYHLPRAALWHQEHGVHFIEHVNTTRLNENPPGAEILATWAMTLDGSDRFAGISQVVALPATVLAIVRIARLIGLGRREAAFGALLFATLPVVALQATTAGNDLLMASFVTIVVAFMLSDSPTALALGAFALGLSVLTKGTALFTIPLLFVVGVILVPRRRWLSMAVAGAVTIVAGGLWYVYHQAEAGTAGSEQNAVVRRGTQPWWIPVSLARLTIDAVDPAGSVGRDRYAYAVVAAVLLVLAGVAAYRRRSRAAGLTAVGAATLVLLPLAFESVYETMRRGYQKVLVGRVDDDVAFAGWSRDATIPTPFTSWYGPLGLIAFVIATVLVARAVRRGSLRKGVLVLALAPLIMLVIVTTTWGYSPWHGRFLISAVALSAATWGLLHRVRALTWGLSAIALVTLVLSFLHYQEKPAGISLLDGTTSRSVWTASREEIITSWAPELTAEGRVIKRVDSVARDGETIAIRLNGDNVSYPYWDTGLERRVVFVDEHDGLEADADWLVVAPKLAVEICPDGWRREFAEGGWRLYRRVGLCPGESAAS